MEIVTLAVVPSVFAVEAVATGADVLAVSCPYEVSRFEDSLKVLGYEKKMVVRDVVELLAEAMEGPGAP